MSQQFDSPPGLTREQAIAKLKAPAICMLVVGALSLLTSIAGLLMSPESTLQMLGQMEMSEQEMDQIRSLMSGPVRFAIAAPFLLLAALTVFGSIKMMGGSKGLGVMAAICAMINIQNCCCIIGLPFGIWALVVLLNADVSKALIAGQPNTYG